MWTDPTGDWARYWRTPDHRLEAMHAHFRRHVYHRHSHETYSFGVTETGVQAFSCRGAARTSAAGMVMAFNPDEPHDGHAAVERGFTYRMLHIAPDLLTEVLADTMGRPVGRPLFAEPVLHDPVLAGALHRLAAAISAEPLAWDEALDNAIRALVRRAAVTEPACPAPAPAVAGKARDLLHARYAEPVSAAELAETAGCSRYAVHRAFLAAYGIAPSDYQRQLRLRAARRLLAGGAPVASVAARVGFADQSHLTRWFGRYYGITPAGYRSAAINSARPGSG